VIFIAEYARILKEPLQERNKGYIKACLRPVCDIFAASIFVLCFG